MVKHIVVFKVKEEFMDEALGMIEDFRKKKGLIPGLKDFSIGTDFVHSARSYDVGLIATLEDKEALNVYANHPVHVPFKTRMAEISSSVVAVDFEE